MPHRQARWWLAGMALTQAQHHAFELPLAEGAALLRHGQTAVQHGWSPGARLQGQVSRDRVRLLARLRHQPPPGLWRLQQAQQVEPADVGVFVRHAEQTAQGRVGTGELPAEPADTKVHAHHVMQRRVQGLQPFQFGAPALRLVECGLLRLQGVVQGQRQRRDSLAVGVDVQALRRSAITMALQYQSAKYDNEGDDLRLDSLGISIGLQGF